LGVELHIFSADIFPQLLVSGRRVSQVSMATALAAACRFSSRMIWFMRLP
jgi:hypothetical protein